MANFTIYNGKFACQTCRVIVPTLRCYADEKMLSWMCKEKHLSKVYLGKRKKSDFDREE